jgi:hypothetical protein
VFRNHVFVFVFVWIATCAYMPCLVASRESEHQQAAQEQNCITNDEALGDFYFVLVAHVLQVLQACDVIRSKWVGNAQHTLGDRCEELLLSAAGALPVVGAFAGMLGKAIRGARERQMQPDINRGLHIMHMHVRTDGLRRVGRGSTSGEGENE